MSVEPTPPCGDDDPEAHAGEPVDDGFADATAPTPLGADPCPCANDPLAACDFTGVNDDGVDSGAVPGQPA